MHVYSPKEQQFIRDVKSRPQYLAKDILFQRVSELSFAPALVKALAASREVSASRLKTRHDRIGDAAHSERMAKKQAPLREFVDPRQEILDLVSALREIFVAAPDISREDMYKEFWRVFKPFITVCSASLATILHGEEEEALVALERLTLFVSIISELYPTEGRADDATNKVLLCLSIFLKGVDGETGGHPVRISGLLDQIVKVAEKHDSPIVKAEAQIFAPQTSPGSQA